MCYKQKSKVVSLNLAHPVYLSVICDIIMLYSTCSCLQAYILPLCRRQIVFLLEAPLIYNIKACRGSKVQRATRYFIILNSVVTAELWAMLKQIKTLFSALLMLYPT